MTQRYEGHFEGADRNELFFQTWTPDKPRGVFVITHGMAEHSECYHSLAKVLSDDGWQVYAWDLRGHGRSEGKRGFILNISDFMADLGIFLKLVRKNSGFEPANTVIFGHSLGGMIVARSAETQDFEYAAMALSSPCMGLSMPVPALKEAAARIAIKLMPTITMFNEIYYEDLTHDPEIIASYRKDTLRHDKVSPGLFLSLVENFPLVIQDADKLKTPTLMQVSGSDRVVSAENSRAFFDRLTGRKNQWILYPESYHEIFNDMERDKAIADLKKFIHPFLGE